MTKGRLEAFSDGVMAILITIMVVRRGPAPAALAYYLRVRALIAR
jgi:uncharacterized membrane protein